MKLFKTASIKKRRPRFSIMAKMLTAFLLVSLSSLLVSGYISLKDIKQVGEYALQSSLDLSSKASDDSTNALKELGEKIIEQKAHDSAVQCAIFIKAHPYMNTIELQQDSKFQRIAVQPVGATGYTLIYEKNTGIMRFHPNKELINFDSLKLREFLPSFCALISKTLNGASFGGYYDWQEPDGTIRQKYMSMVPINGTDYIIAATTYIDDFLKPAQETKTKIGEATNRIRNHIHNEVDSVLDTFLTVFIILFVAVFFISLILSRMITQPITALTEGAKVIGKGNLDYKVEVKTRDEFEELAAAFNKMTFDLKEYMKKLRHSTNATQGLLKELELARKIQQSILPKRAPKIEGIDIAAKNIPAREVGGDFYDFIPVTKNMWGLAIADVSGKGMPAAIFMGLSRTLVRASTSGTTEISSAIQHANELICRDSTSGMFVTLFYGVLDGKTLDFTYVNAGHNPPLLLRNDTLISLNSQEIPLGVKKNIDIREKSIQLKTGDLVILYTDGVTEALNEAEERFGQERLVATIRNHTQNSAHDIIETIHSSLQNFAGNQPQFDDITLMVLKVEG